MAAEHKIEIYLTKKAKEHGFLCYKFKSPGINGVPDRILMGHGITFFVETKAPGEVPRAQQCKRHKEMQDHGAIVYVIDNKEDIDALFTDNEIRKIKMALKQNLKQSY